MFELVGAGAARTRLQAASARGLTQFVGRDAELAVLPQALVLAAELGMRPLQAHRHRGLGTLYLKTAQREPACAALSAAIALYRAMDMTFWLPQAEER